MRLIETSDEEGLFLGGLVFLCHSSLTLPLFRASRVLEAKRPPRSLPRTHPLCEEKEETPLLGLSLFVQPKITPSRKFYYFVGLHFALFYSFLLY